MTIEYYKKDVYGVTLIYIKDPRIAMTIGMLTGKKTVSKFDIKALTDLGCTFTEVLR